MTDAQAFPHWQGDLPEKFGLPLCDLRAWRNRYLKKGEHWQTRDNRCYWSDAGVALVRAQLHLPPKNPPVPLPAPSPKPWLRVVESAPRVRNARLIVCELELAAGAARVNVAVRDNRAFPLQWLIRPEEYTVTAAGHFVFTGRPPKHLPTPHAP